MHTHAHTQAAPTRAAREEGLLEAIEADYRRQATFGIKFSIDADAHKAPKGVSVEYANHHALRGYAGEVEHWSDIIVNGKECGYLLEIENRGRCWRPVVTRFLVEIADCGDANFHEQYATYRNHPHFLECDEQIYLSFATLGQFVSYLKNK